MPAPVREVILAPETVRVSLRPEPTMNALNSLMMLTRYEDMPGLDPWVERTAKRLTQRELDKNLLVMLGLYFAVIPERSWPSFPEYIDQLQEMDPIELRDRVLDAYLSLPCENSGVPEVRDEEKDEILTDVEGFLAFLRGRFPPENIIEPVERQAYSLLANPPQMRTIITEHFRAMWNKVLAEEWTRTEPLIQESVEAFDSLDLSAYDDAQLVRLVTGKSTGELEKLVEHMALAERVVFVPSVHNGPYLTQFLRSKVLWVMFGARVPANLRRRHSALSRAEVIVWLSALADDTRLRILTQIQEQGEQCAQSVIDRLELSQSTASRHLRQLAASGFLRERRTEAGKCYSLNSDRFQELIRELELFTNAS